MKRSNGTTQALVYAYGCGQPLAGWDHAQAENERCGILWDRLVQVERDYERGIKDAARADVPELDALLTQIAALRATITRENRHEVRREIRTVERATWPLLAGWRKANKNRMAEFTTQRFADVVRERHATSAWWCNYNAVIQRYETARKETKSRGRSLRMRDIERDDGCLTVQIQRTRSGFGAAPGELQAGSLSALAIARVPDAAYDPRTFRGNRRRLCRTVMEMRVDADGNTIRLPVWIHRELPDDCRVKQAQLVWSRRGEHYTYRLCLMITRPATMRVNGASYSATVSVGIVPRDRELQVATITSPVEDSYIALDARWLGLMERVAHLQSVIADENATDHARIRARMEQPGLMQRLMRHRTERYRLLAVRLCSDYRRVVIETPALSELAYLDRGEIRNAHRHMACAHSLIAAITHQGRKRGCDVSVIVAERDASAVVPLKVRHKRNKGLRTVTSG